MADSNRNRNSSKGNENVSRTGSQSENRGNRKLRDNDRNSDESITTAGDASNPKYSKTSVRKDEKENRENSDKSR